jgi:hypothetical protein
MSDGARVRAQRWLLNTGALGLAGLILMAITNDRNGREFYPSWLLWSAGVCSALGFAIAYALRRSGPAVTAPEPAPIASVSLPSAAEEPAWTWEDWSKAARADHALIEKLCRRHKITLVLSVRGQNGHASSPDEWTFSAPIPLTPDDIATLATHRTLHVESETTAGGVVVARGFSHTDGWSLYTVVG